MLSLICLTCVSAADNNQENAVVLINNTGERCMLEVTQNAGTFSELSGKIYSADKVLKLDKDYKFDPIKDDKKTFYEYGIEVNRENFVIDGQGHTIDGSNQARLLFVSKTNVTLKNINFINGNGGNTAVDLFGEYAIVEHCNFTNNCAPYYSSALIIDGGIVSDCNFDNNHGDYGALYSIWDDVKVLNCKFTNNVNRCGAIGFSCNAIVDNCTFIKNVATEDGGAFSGRGNITISNSSFYQNSAKNGGAFDLEGGNINIINCHISDNSALSGGAISNCANLNIINTTFNNNFVPKEIIDGSTIKVVNVLNNFINHRYGVFTADDASFKNMLTLDDINYNALFSENNESTVNFKLSINYFDQIVNKGYVYLSIPGLGEHFTFDVVDGIANITIPSFKTGIYEAHVGYVLSGNNYDLGYFAIFCKNNGKVGVSIKDNGIFGMHRAK